jgi:hypothetical protein
LLALVALLWSLCFGRFALVALLWSLCLKVAQANVLCTLLASYATFAALTTAFTAFASLAASCAVTEQAVCVLALNL